MMHPEISRNEVEEFLYEEAALLDGWKLREWLELLAEAVLYEVPSADRPHGDLTQELGFIRDDRHRLEGRVTRLLSRRAHREFPWSRTRRLVTNVRIIEGDTDSCSVTANFAIWRFRGSDADVFVGMYRYQLVRSPDGSLLIASKRAELDLESLHPHGTVSIIL